MSHPIPDKTIVALIEEATRNRTKLVSLVDEIDAKFRESGYAYKMQLPPEMVGIHPGNRDGYGLHADSVQALGVDIVKAGFSWAATSHACGMEDADAEIERFSMTLVADSECLPKFRENDIKIGSLSCSHTNAFLLSAKQGVASHMDVIAENGFISVAKFCRDDSAMQEAIAKGLRWLIYKKEVGKMYPA